MEFDLSVFFESENGNVIHFRTAGELARFSHFLAKGGHYPIHGISFDDDDDEGVYLRLYPRSRNGETVLDYFIGDRIIYEGRCKIVTVDDLTSRDFGEIATGAIDISTLFSDVA